MQGGRGGPPAWPWNPLSKIFWPGNPLSKSLFSQLKYTLVRTKYPLNACWIHHKWHFSNSNYEKIASGGEIVIVTRASYQIRCLAWAQTLDYWINILNKSAHIARFFLIIIEDFSGKEYFHVHTSWLTNKHLLTQLLCSVSDPYLLQNASVTRLTLKKVTKVFICFTFMFCFGVKTRTFMYLEMRFFGD